MLPRKHNKELTVLAKNLRKNMTKEERKLWYDFLRSYPVRVLRQKVIDDYIVDFYCHKARLIIELDGSQHYEYSGIIEDVIRTQNIAKRGLTVIRIPNNLIHENFNGVCEYIDYKIKQNLNTCEKNPSVSHVLDSSLKAWEPLFLKILRWKVIVGRGLAPAVFYC